MMKRILHIVGTMNRAGAETMIMNLYREIDKSKYQFDFVVFTDRKNDYEDEILSLGGKIHVINTNNPLKRLISLKQLLSSNKQYQIIHCHTNFSNAFHLIAGALAKVQIRIAHSHNTTDKSHNVIIRFCYQFLTKILINTFATHYISCGKEASKLLFYRSKKVLILPNSVNLKHLAQLQVNKKNYVNSLFNFDESVLKIIQVGRLQFEKNHVFSIELAQLLKARAIPFKMFFLGAGELEKELKLKVKSLGLNEDIIFLGVRDDVPEFMAGSDLMLMPSLYEGFPVVLVESQAVGLPSLISDSISDEVDLKVNSIFFEKLSNQKEEWVDKIIKILSEKKVSLDKRVEIISKSGFDTESNASFLLDFYNSK